MSDLNPLLYGKDAEERLVGIHLHTSSSVLLYTRTERDRVVSREEPLKPFAFFTDKGMELLSEKMSGYRAYPLKGDHPYRHLVTFSDWGHHWDGVKAVRDYEHNGEKAFRNEVYYIASPEDQYLMQTGKTLYKGMSTDDVKRMQVDIEVYSSTGAFPLAERPDDRVFIVSLSDNRGWEKILRLENALASPRDDEEVFSSESDLLRGFIREIHRQDPDILEFHNGFGFDLDYIAARCKKHGFDMSIGRNNRDTRTWAAQKKFAERDVGYTNHLCAGRSIVDTMFYALAFDVFTRALPSAGLKAVADYLREEEGVSFEEMYGRERSYVKGEKISDLWDTDPDRLLDYALDDVRETGYLSEKFAGATFYLSQMLPMTYQEVHLAGSGRIIESVMVREYIRHMHSLPKPEIGSQAHGGYTDIFYTGRFRNLVYADVESLYPSIMLKYRCHPESDVLGVHRSMLEQLTDLRLDTKAQSKAAKLEGDFGLASTLKAMEQAYKIIINSQYGVMSDQWSLFNDISEADRVALTGQALLKRMIEIIERQFGGTVIECDSVTADTPVYIRRGEQVDIVSIATLHDSTEKRRFDGFDGIEILTRGGWRGIKYTKRHHTDKPILDVRTLGGVVAVTNDHSLFTDGEEVRPRDLNVGDHIDMYDLPPLPASEGGDYDHGWLLGIMAAEGSASRTRRAKGGWTTNVSCAEKDMELLGRVCDLAFKYYGTRMKVYDTSRSSGSNKATGGYNLRDYTLWADLLYDPATHQKRVPTVVLNGSREMKQGFFDGAMRGDGYGDKTYTSKSRVLAAGMFWLAQELGVCEYVRVDARADKATVANLIFRHGREGWTFGTKGEVRHLFERETGVDVYDVSTEDGTFIAGVGGIICHNTDGALYVCREELHGNLDAQVAEVEAISAMMPDGINVGMDGLFDVMISYRKKNYALRDYDGKIKTKGGAFKNRGIEPYGRDYQREMLAALMDGDVDAMYKIHDSWKQRIIDRDWTISDFETRKVLKDSIDVYLGKVADGGNRQAQYEIAIRQGEASGRPPLKGDSVYYYVSGNEKPYKVRSYIHGKPSEEWVRGDENTLFYLDRLKKFAGRFEAFFHPDDFERLFKGGANLSRSLDLFGEAAPPDFSGTEIVSKKVN